MFFILLSLWQQYILYRNTTQQTPQELNQIFTENDLEYEIDV